MSTPDGILVGLLIAALCLLCLAHGGLRARHEKLRRCWQNQRETIEAMNRQRMIEAMFENDRED